MQSKNTQLDLRGLALVVVVGAWLTGIVLDYLFHDYRFPLPAFALLMGACAALLFLIPLWRDKQARLVMLVLLWLLLGAWRYAIALPDGDPQAISAYIGTGKIEVRGSVSDEPKLAGKTRLLPIAVSGVSTDGGINWQDAHGQLEVQTLGGEVENPYGPNYGDDVELQGKLQPRTPYTSPGVFASMAFPRVSVSSTGVNPILAVLYHLRNRLASIIAQSLPQPEAALLIAIFVT